MALIKSAISRFRKGLGRTREGFVSGLRSLVRGRAIDDQLIADVERTLIQGDVGVKATATLIEGIRQDHKAGKLERGEDVIEYLKTELKARWPDVDRQLQTAASGPTVILVTGVNGAGKTTSIAKLCALLRGQDKSVMLAACDTFRAGAVRQLEIWAERLDVEIVKGQQGGDPAAVAYDGCQSAIARNIDVLIIDTAGRLHTQDPLMRQLTKIRAVIARQIEGGPHETLLVLDATAGQNALRQAEHFSAAAEVSGIFLAKLDGTARGGIVIAIKDATAIPVKFIGVGETLDDIEPFDPESFVEALFSDDG